jgi:hypothetical protein
MFDGSHAQAVNGVTQIVRGELLRLIGDDSVGRMQADVTANLSGYMGVAKSGVINQAGSVDVCINGAEEVLLEDGLAPVAGQTLYVSSTVAGRATNIAPAIAFPIGSIKNASSYSRNRRVKAILDRASAAGAGIPAFSSDYQFTILFPSSLDGLVAGDPRWLAAAHADGEFDADDFDRRGYPFVSPGLVDAGHYDFWVQVLAADAVDADVGVWQWVFTLMINNLPTAVTAVITSNGGVQFQGSSGALVVPSGVAVGVRVQGSQVSGGPATVGTILAFVRVTLRP